MLLLATVGLQCLGEDHDLPTPYKTETNKWSFTGSALFMSRYYGTIFGGIFYDGPMYWWDVIGAREDRIGRLTLDLSIGQKMDRLNRFNADGGNEYDFTVTYTFKPIGPKRFPVIFEVSTCFLALVPLQTIKDDAWSKSVRVDFPILADRKEGSLFQPYFQAYHYNAIGGLGDKGWFLYAGAFRDQPLHCSLFGNPLKLNLDYRTGYCVQAYGGKSGLEYHRLTLSLPIHKGKWTFVPAVIGQIPNSSGRTFVHDNPGFYGTLAITHPL